MKSVIRLLLATVVLVGGLLGFREYEHSRVMADIRALTTAHTEFAALTVRKIKPNRLLIDGSLKSRAELDKLLQELEQIEAILFRPSISFAPEIAAWKDRGRSGVPAE
jgi:ribosome biogenesis SPOUT family RNA methylase Rps3